LLLNKYYQLIFLNFI